MYLAPPWRVPDFVACPCILDVERDSESSKGREMNAFPECPFSESDDFIDGDRVLITLKSIRTLITPTSRIRMRQGGDGNHRTI
jgi:hypothetical protein